MVEHPHSNENQEGNCGLHGQGDREEVPPTVLPDMTKQITLMPGCLLEAKFSKPLEEGRRGNKRILGCGICGIVESAARAEQLINRVVRSRRCVGCRTYREPVSG